MPKNVSRTLIGLGDPGQKCARLFSKMGLNAGEIDPNLPCWRIS